MLNSKKAYIEIDSLSISHKNGTHSTDVCHKFNLRINAGEIVGILGPNGSGKSSLINAILGNIHFQGKVIFDGFSRKLPKIAYIPQDYKSSFFSWISLKNNIRITKDGFHQEWKKTGIDIDENKNKLGVGFDLGLKPKSCSGGMLQQASILRAIYSQEGIILADEPFSALDVNINRSIRARFREIVKDKSIICLMVLHNIDDILAVCDKLIVIPNKPYTSDGTLSDYYEVKEFVNTNTTVSHSTDSLLDIANKVFKKL